MIRNFKADAHVKIDLAMDGITCIFGRPGSGKSSVASTLRSALYSIKSSLSNEKNIVGPYYSYSRDGATRCTQLDDELYSIYQNHVGHNPSGGSGDSEKCCKQIEPFLLEPVENMFPKKWSYYDSDSIKPFRYVGMLVLNGWLRRSDLLISDCSEARIHPMLQIEYAKLLVELYHTLGIQLVVISNSIDFWHALRMYAAKLELNDKIDLYEVLKANLDEPASTVRIENDDFEKLFGMFIETVVEPLEAMRNELDEYPHINQYTRK